MQHESLANLPPGVRNALRTRFYFDSCHQYVPVGGLNLLSTLEFLNHSPEPNLVPSQPLNGWLLWECARDIQPGEELTIDYRTFLPDVFYFEQQVAPFLS